MHSTRRELSKLNGMRSGVNLSRHLCRGSRLQILDGDVALGVLQDPGQVSGGTTVYCTSRQRLRPHGIIRQTMNADEGGGREFTAKLGQLLERDHFKIHD